jgi:hypothetical protein
MQARNIIECDLESIVTTTHFVLYMMCVLMMEKLGERSMCGEQKDIAILYVRVVLYVAFNCHREIIREIYANECF